MAMCPTSPIRPRRTLRQDRLELLLRAAHSSPMRGAPECAIDTPSLVALGQIQNGTGGRVAGAADIHADSPTPVGRCRAQRGRARAGPYDTAPAPETGRHPLPPKVQDPRFGCDGKTAIFTPPSHGPGTMSAHERPCLGASRGGSGRCRAHRIVVSRRYVQVRARSPRSWPNLPWRECGWSPPHCRAMPGRRRRDDYTVENYAQLAAESGETGRR